MRSRRVWAGMALAVALVASVGNSAPAEQLFDEVELTLAPGERMVGTVDLMVDDVELYRDLYAIVTYRPRRAELQGTLASGAISEPLELSRGEGMVLIDVADGVASTDTGMATEAFYEATLTLENLSEDEVRLTVRSYTWFEEGQQGTISLDYVTEPI